MEKQERRVSKKYAKRYFNTVGLFLILYVLFVLILPYFFHYYMSLTESSILNDKIMYLGIYFIIVLFGTIIPFFMMRLYFKVDKRKLNRNVSATFVNLFVQTIVCFTVCLGLTYVSNLIFSRFNLDSELLGSIGLSFSNSYLKEPLYVFMLVIVSPIIEEYAFRGVLLNTLGKFGKRFALYSSALMFALAHVSFSEMIPAFAMAITLGKTSYRYRSIKPTIIIHILFNSLIYILCIIPQSVTKYMAYGLTATFVLTIYLILSGRYERVTIQKLHSIKSTNLTFYSSFTIILAIVLMIFSSVLFLIRL